MPWKFYLTVGLMMFAEVLVRFADDLVSFLMMMMMMMTSIDHLTYSDFALMTTK